MELYINVCIESLILTSWSVFGVLNVLQSVLKYPGIAAIDRVTRSVETAFEAWSVSVLVSEHTVPTPYLRGTVNVRHVHGKEARITLAFEQIEPPV